MASIAKQWLVRLHHRVRRLSTVKFTQSSHRRAAHSIAPFRVPVWQSELSKVVAVVSERPYFLAVPVHMTLCARDECSKNRLDCTSMSESVSIVIRPPCRV